MPEKPILETVQAQHPFSAEEQQQLAKSLVARMQELCTTENELDSIKQDYKAKLTRIETDRDNIAQKIRDGFEMRPCEAIVLFDTPSKGRKTYVDKDGPVIREECMSGPDFQRSLPLEEKPPSNEDLADSFDPAAPVPSKDTPPAGYVIVTEGVSQEGDMAWEEPGGKWSLVTETGIAAGSHNALARPVSAETELPDEPLARKDTAARTPFGEALHAAAAGKDLPLVPVLLSSEFPPEKARAMFRKHAKKNGWPEAAIDLLDEEAKKVVTPDDAEGSILRVLAVLNPHTVQEAK